MQEFKVDKSAAGMRADIFIASKFPEFTRSSLKGLFEQGYVQLNGASVGAGDKLRPGDSVDVNTTLLKAVPEAIDLPVIYEDSDIVVINKPAGVLTHSKGALNLEPTVASFLSPKIKDKELTGNRAGIVHRLDRGTSGLIIGAKNTKALRYLQKQFSTRKVKKTYLAIVEGWPKPDQAIIDAPIMRDPKKPQTFKVGVLGKPAQTTYKTLKKTSKNGQDYSLLELQPFTGRTHQLRVHLAYIKHPIVGDNIYGHDGDNLLLHAQKLELTLPNRTGQEFSVAPPSTFNRFYKFYK